MFEKVFPTLFIWFCRGFLDFRGKEIIEYQFFIEQGIVCEKQELAGMTDSLSSQIEVQRKNYYDQLEKRQRATPRLQIGRHGFWIATAKPFPMLKIRLRMFYSSHGSGICSIGSL